MDRIEKLEKQRVGKLILSFSLPAIIGMMVTASYNIVDRIFVGKGVGALAISGITVTFPMILIFMAFGMLVGVGATAIVSLRLGEKRHNDAEATLGNAFTLVLIISTVLMLLGYIFLNDFLIAFGGSGEVLEYAREYSIIILAGTIFQFTAFSLNNIIRGEGNPKTAMATMLIGSILNIILNPLFIFGLKLGIRGSALATVISQFVSCTWVLSYFLGKRSHLKFRISNLRLRKEIVMKIFSIGISPFSMMIASSVIMVIYNQSLSSYGGDIAIAVFGIGNSLINFIMMPVFGINQGIQPIIGYNYGAKLFSRVRDTLRLASIWATVVCTAGFAVVMIFTPQVISLFSKDDPSLLSLGTSATRMFLSSLPIVGFQVVNGAYFQAVGKAKFSLILTLFRQVIILTPLLFIFPALMGLNGVWWAEPVSDGISAILSAIFIMNEFRLLNRNIISGKSSSDDFKTVESSIEAITENSGEKIIP